MSSSHHMRTGAHRPRRRPGALALPVLLALVVVAAVVVGLRAASQRGTADGGGPAVAVSSATSSPRASASVSATPSAIPSSAGPSASSPPVAVDRSAAVTVLNATRRAGLATRAAATLRSAGWSVASTGNSEEPPLQTTVYYSDAQLRETARAVSSDLPGVQRVERSSRFGDGVVTVVLASDYAG